VVRVLIVVGSPLISDLVRMACANTSDLRVVAEAEHSDRGLELCRELSPEVIVFDPSIDEHGGLKFVRSLGHGPGVPRLLAIVDDPKPAWLLEAMELGVGGVVPRTPLPRDLTAVLRSIAQGGHLISPELHVSVLSHLDSRIRQTRERSRVVAALSNRQLEVLGLLGQGLTTRQVALRLRISERTAEAHISQLYDRLGVRTRMEAVRRGLELGLIVLEV
jgi:DNA-binding NarL/FixJ family response regulator